MKTGTLLLLGLAAFVGYEVYQSVSGNNIQIVFNGVTINGVLDYTLQFLVQNTSNAQITINSLAADVTLNGNEFGNVSMFTPVTVQPNAQTQVNVSLKPSALALPASVLQVVQNPSGNFDFKVEGSMNVNGIPLPVNVEKVLAV